MYQLVKVGLIIRSLTFLFACDQTRNTHYQCFPRFFTHEWIMEHFLLFISFKRLPRKVEIFFFFFEQTNVENLESSFYIYIYIYGLGLSYTWYNSKQYYTTQYFLIGCEY